MKKLHLNWLRGGGTLRRVGLVLVLCLIAVGQMWAGGFFTSNMWQIYGWNGSTNGWHWKGYGSSSDCNLGIITSGTYCFKGLGVNTYGSDVQGVYCNVTYPNGTSNNKTIGWKSGSGDKYWENTSMWDYTISFSTPGNYQFSLQFYLNSGGDDYGHNTRKITWTVPGFSTTSTSKSFGTTIPVNTESETTISFGTHYGTALTTSNCALSGTNASMFTVRSIDENGVKLSFSPGNSTGAKSATLTITDAHNKTCTITLTATVVAAGTKTRLYFNDYKNHSGWSASSAKYRFTVQYTDGVYTHYPMTKCDNSTYNWYADVEIKSKTVSIDRYNPNSPYQTWSSCAPSSNALSTTYVYAISNSTTSYSAYATNHHFQEVSGGKIYYDNLESAFTNTLYLVIGHDYSIDNGSSNTYSSGYSLANVPNTKLYYKDLSTTWHDATYYAVIGASSDPTGNHSWGSSSLSSKGTGGYTKANTDMLDLLSGNVYLATASASNSAMTITKRASTAASSFNTSQTFNYALSTDGGSSYSALTSGVNTPGQLSLASYKFVDGTYNAVTQNSAQTLSANGTTYTKTYGSVAYTGTTTLTESNTRDGYTFIGWYEGSTLVTASAGTKSYTYYPRGNRTLTARYKAHRYTIAFSANDAQYSSAPAATGSTASISNVVYDQNATLTANGFSRSGYTFAGWNTEPDGSGTPYSNSASVSNLTTSDNVTVTLYAQWTEITHTVTVKYKYGDEEIADDGEVTGVGITTAQEVTAPTPIGGYSFTTWSAMPSGVTKASGELTDATISINATADGQTIVANYEPATYNGTLEGVDGSDGTYSVVYGETSLTVTSAPARSGYHVYRYYLTYDEGDYSNYIAESSETTSKALRSDVSISSTDYTDANSKWIYTGSAPTIYVKWEEDTYTITLDKSLPSGTTGVAGDNNFTVSYNNNNYSFGDNLSSRPVAEGYTFAGYYTDDVSPVQVIKADGSLNTSTAYVSGIGKWQHAGNVTLYAHWTDNHIYYYNGATADGWSTASNWTKGAVPASDGSNTIHILKPLVISSDKKVAAVDIITSGTYTPTGGSAIDASGKLTINPNVGLNVTGTVTRTADATSNLATREGDLVLESSSAGNASLIFDNSYSCQATVQMYSKASISGSTWNWQYVGTPFTGSIPLYNYYGSWMYKWNNGGWDVVKGSDELTPFAGYCLTQESATTHVMGGTLVPTTSKSVTMSASTDMVLANSWTAPIYIGDFTASTFTSTPATIYLFNTGSAENGSSAGSEAGTYVAIPIFTTPYVGGGLIAPMQGFFVTTNGGSAGTITMNYADLVRPADNRSIVAGPMYAPKRAEEGDEPVLQDQPEEAPTVLKIWANGSVYNDRLVILAREDFSEGFDNGWDGEKMSFGSASPSVYVINAQGGYDAVSAIPTLEGTVVGFRAGTDNQYTMTFSYEGEDEWYLNDLKAETSTLITSAQTYSFSAAQADSEARFIISKTPINKVPTGFDAINDGSYAHKQLINGTLYIIRDGRIYDAQGALVK